MNMLGSFNRLLSNVKGYYQGINCATLTGAIDVIVVEQPDGSLKSTPFHVRFGKYGVFRPSETKVDIFVNGVMLTELEMKLGSSGEAYFEIGEDGEVITSAPINPSPPSKEAMSIESETTEDNNMTGNFETMKPASTGVEVPADFILCQSSSTEDPVNPVSPSTSSATAFTATLSVQQSALLCRSDPDLTSSITVGSTQLSSTAPIASPPDNLAWEWGQLPQLKNQRPLTPTVFNCGNDTQVTNTNSAGAMAIDSTERSDVPPVTISSMEPACTDDNTTQPMEVTPIRQLPVAGDEPQEFLLSLCGGMDKKHEPSLERFLQHQVRYEDFVRDPVALMQHPDLVVRCSGRFFTWSAISSALVAALAYQMSLPETQMSELNVSSPNSHPHSAKSSPEKTLSPATSPGKETASASTGSPSRTSRLGLRNWLWGSGRSTAPTASASTTNEASPTSQNKTLEACHSDGEVSSSSRLPQTGMRSEEVLSDSELTQSGSLRQPSASEPRPTENTVVEVMPDSRQKNKTIRLHSDLLKRLNLKAGANEAVFSVTSRYRGTTKCSCYIYLWRWTDRLVISDVDGTITKSDVLGHIMGLVGLDWAQCGIAELYHQISCHGYRVVYVTARAIGQAATTRNYLRQLRQEGLGLPDGPILLSPSSLFRALHKEVIERCPEEFKIRCLSDVQSLFPQDSEALHAGFGNRENDVITYKTLGIHPRRIFTVNFQGQLRHELPEEGQVLTYSSLGTSLSMYFPSFIQTTTLTSVETVCQPSEGMREASKENNSSPTVILSDPVMNLATDVMKIETALKEEKHQHSTENEAFNYLH